ncbi:hypothetical protein BCR44DRAFT_42374 [Catenaria anguillulae PL171]|uniref:BTB domain-containing protein n=1 Tax=Catenaria anguillulae PL171 TaxID=765915 RepID=A0A1Y2H3P3_9FUNG|nr:hypothetical protein BCR44DRAFT_42374 [Catenaria anguillulae PL171]
MSTTSTFNATSYHITSSSKYCHAYDAGNQFFNLPMSSIQSSIGTLNFAVRSGMAGYPYIDVVMCVCDTQGVQLLPRELLISLKLYVKKHSKNKSGNSWQWSEGGPLCIEPLTRLLSSSDLGLGSVTTFTFAIPAVHGECAYTVENVALGISLPFTPASVNARLGKLVSTLNSPAVCDCMFELRDGIQITASKAVLAAASQFFATKFQEPQWSAQPIKFDSWSVKAALPCLMHLYNGWVPSDGELPSTELLKGMIEENEVYPLQYSMQDWLLVLDLAQMLELSELIKRYQGGDDCATEGLNGTCLHHAMCFLRSKK